MNLMVKYRAKMKGKEEGIDDFLQTPQAKLEKPLLIQSASLGEHLYLVANEAQAGEIEREGKVCYLPGEIRALLTYSNGMDEEGLMDYLNKIHAVKKTFPGARVGTSRG